MGQWIVGVISFQKIFGLCGLKGHIEEIRWDVPLEDPRTTECEDRARILDSEFATCAEWQLAYLRTLGHKQVYYFLPSTASSSSVAAML